jgi:HK97 family phage major capsid protein
MAKLHELRRERAALATTRNELVTQLREARAAWRKALEDTPPGDEVPPEAKPLEGRVTECESALDTHQKSLDAHDARIGQLESAQDDDAERAIALDEAMRERREGGIGHNTNGYGYNEPGTMRTGLGFRAARFAIGVLVARGNGMAAASEYVERRFYDKEVAKALNTTGVATGGALIPQAFSNEVIELLRAMTVIRKLNPMIVDMPMGNLTIPRLAAGATAGYQGELDDMSSSQETFDDLQLNAKKLTALVPVSNDLIRRAPANIEGIVRDDMTQSVARREDLAFMLGDGSGNSPIGLLNLCNAAAKLIVAPFTATDNATILTAVNAVLLSMRLTLVNNFSRMIRPAWITTPTTEAFLLGLRDQVGNFVYKDEMEEKKTIWGIRYEMTQQLPTNISAAVLGGGTANDGTYLMLADFADVVLAETYNMVVDASDVASYKDSGGNMVSTFTRDQTAFRIITEHDFNLRHQASLAVGLLPAWAPAGWTGYTGGSPYYSQPPSGDMSAAPSTWGIAAPTGSNNPGNSSANAPGGTQPGRP